MNSRSMLRRLNRRFPPPDPDALRLAKAREFFEFATHRERDEVADLFERMTEMGMSFEQFAEKEPQRAERLNLVLKAIHDRQVSGIKPPRRFIRNN